MPWFLQMQDGHRFDDAAALEEGQSVVVGRSDSVDVSCPQDADMSSRHVSLQIKDGQCHVQDLQSTNGCFLNNELVQTGILNSGDLLRCGNTVLRLESSEQSAAAGGDTPASTEVLVTSPAAAAASVAETSSPVAEIPEELQQCEGFVADTAMAVVERFSLQELIDPTPDAAVTLINFIDRLLQADDTSVVLKFLACALPKRLGVWWAVQCVRSESRLTTDRDGEILDLVVQWVQDPQDGTRRAAMQLAQDHGLQTPACWCAVAAFWATGSMSPAGQPDVPAGDEMAGRAISGATQLASVVVPEQATARCEEFTQLALAMSAGEHSWAEAAL